MVNFMSSGEKVSRAQTEIEECKAELVRAKQIRRNKQGLLIRCCTDRILLTSVFPLLLLLTTSRIRCLGQKGDAATRPRADN